MPSKFELQQQLNYTQINLERYRVVDQYLPMAVEIGRRITAAVDNEELGFADIVEVVDTVMDDITDEERKKRVLDVYGALAPQDKLQIMSKIFGSEGMEEALREEHERVIREKSLSSAMDRIRSDAAAYNRIPLLEIPPKTPVKIFLNTEYNTYRRQLLFEALGKGLFKLTDDIFSHAHIKAYNTNPLQLGEIYGLKPTNAGLQSDDGCIYFDNSLWISYDDYSSSKLNVGTVHNSDKKDLLLTNIHVDGNDIRSQAKKIAKFKTNRRSRK